ncbi:MAG: sulfatase-like hydrolase/transferase [Bifidobacteriaceae bacterium]|nr:sulfatase-like hydrolase/transferase [Bifidobacteriaceae bacterium]MCI1979720.1 sulfatase-like hydrolase/transferase [Bifidobacteriaceae bacterium]
MSTENHNAAEPETSPDQTDSSAEKASDVAGKTRKRQRIRRAHGYALWFYVLAFLAVDTLGVMLLQWSANYVEPFSAFLNFVNLMFISGRFVFILNLLVLGVFYFALIAAINRFWIATPVFIAIVTIVAVVERMKVMVRNETILPSDLKMAGTNTTNLAEFIPAGSGRLFIKICLFLLVFILLCVLLAYRDGKAQLFTRNTRLLGTNLGVYITARILIFLLPAGLLVSYASSLGTVGTWAYNFSETLGDAPRLWDSVEDAQGNGTLIGFLRFTNPKVMDEPKGYSKAAMEKIAKKYETAAKELNEDRSADMTDSSVIMILSESFSDPTRVPGVKLNKDPMPNIRATKASTTSGLMLSSGYGGGTANLEFQALTGLSMANFDASLSSPYQQLVPKMSWAPTFNQPWNEMADGSLAFHPYYSSMYSRQQNYKKFGFQHFWTLSGPEYIAHTDRIDKNPYVSDKSSYQSVLDKLESTQSDKADTKFYQLVTMQNHMGYDNWYDNNEFEATSSTGTALGPDENQQINTYSKGMSYTDTATKDFLNKLDKIDKPITVIFYGDHLPGIYASASRDTANSVALHETDYFIWSNKASASHGHKLSAEAADYTSPNFLMAQTAEHMDAKVSPYLAFLTELHEQISAMEPPVANHIQQWGRIPTGEYLNLDSKGNQIEADKLTTEQKELLSDYKLIQYDITAGEKYLENTGFMNLPGKDKEASAAPKAATSSDDSDDADDSADSDVASSADSASDSSADSSESSQKAANETAASSSADVKKAAVDDSDE